MFFIVNKNLHKYIMNFESYLNEALKIKYVVRDKKRVKKYKTTRPGKYRVEYDENRTSKRS